MTFIILFLNGLCNSHRAFQAGIFVAKTLVQPVTQQLWKNKVYTCLSLSTTIVGQVLYAA